MKTLKTIEHAKYRITVEKTNRGDYVTTYWDKGTIFEADKVVDYHSTLEDAYAFALGLMAEENHCTVYNGGI